MPDAAGPPYDATEAVSARYPGRACLLGEHCDWAGGASLAVPLPIGVRVDAAAGAVGSGVTLSTALDGESVTGRWNAAGSVDPDGGPLRFVPAALHALASRGVRVPATELRVSSDLPPGRGFSSSAAFTLAVVDALSRRAGQELDRPTLARLAFEVEHDLLGVDCGLLDQIACAEGAPVFIRWGGEEPAVRPVRPGALFHLVALALPAARDTRRILAALNRHFFSAGSGAGSEDEEAGAGNRAQDGRQKGATGAVRAALAVFASAAEAGATAMETGSAAALASAMNEAQEAYEVHLHSVLPELRAPMMLGACADLRGDGALAAKFSGAGGEGSVIALFADEGAARAATERLERSDVGSALYCPVGRATAQ